MASRIKSPLLYQLSYRPNVSRPYGKVGAASRARGAIVPSVYPDTASELDVLEPLRRVTT